MLIIFDIYILYWWIQEDVTASDTAAAGGEELCVV